MITSLAVMLVSVFSPPKQVAEETVETPQTEQAMVETTASVDESTQQENNYSDYFYLDDHGNEVWLTEEGRSGDGKKKSKKPLKKQTRNGGKARRIR